MTSRAELTDAQRADHHVRREEILKRKGMVQSAGGDRKSNGQNVHLKSYAKQTADTLGVDERTVRRDLARGKNITPDVLAEVAEPSRYRLRIEAAIESLIALLDEIDGDPDLEDSGDSEPSLCGIGVNPSVAKGKHFARGVHHDLEDEDEGYDPSEAAFVMDQTRAGKAWAS